MAIDMWSLGCILAELYTGYPLFPGENEQEQLACIMEIQGLPDKYLVERSTRKKVFFGMYFVGSLSWVFLIRAMGVSSLTMNVLTRSIDPMGAPKLVVNSKGKKRKPGAKTLTQALKCSDPLFLDFVARCLTWDPEKRMKPREGLQHEWISEVRTPTRSLFSPPTLASENSLNSSVSSIGSSNSLSSRRRSI